MGIDLIHNFLKWIFVSYKCYISIELTFLKELKLIRQANEKSDICHYWHILNKGFKFQLYVCNRYHDLVMMSMNLAILLFDTLKVLIIACCEISKSETINLMQNIDLTKKSGC